MRYRLLVAVLLLMLVLVLRQQRRRRRRLLLMRKQAGECCMQLLPVQLLGGLWLLLLLLPGAEERGMGRAGPIAVRSATHTDSLHGRAAAAAQPPRLAGLAAAVILQTASRQEGGQGSHEIQAGLALN